MRTLKTPNITPLQVVGLVTSSLHLLRVFGVELTKEQADAIVDLTQMIAAIVFAEAVVRGARAIGTGGSVPD